ncbi:hypothetical protein P3339_06430 [Microbulbifer sp. MLAF003]|uniref:hypothetical protein n=1 Tax=Microbulbifer TaxID=48073 RepID=UPI000360A49E|nr:MULTISPECIES: hypothetical protein [Microbulbifer]WHI52414.1 hypothetical protein P3339_06430 [Microbulbifer sp. MLAF003]
MEIRVFSLLIAVFLSNSALAERLTIPELMPVDVYQSLTALGFSKKGPKKSGSSIPEAFAFYSWELAMTEGTDSYNVEIFSDSGSDVYKIDATLMQQIALKPNKASPEMLEFLSYMCTLPYGGSNIETAKSWLEKNININEATTDIGGVSFTVYSPSGALRMLTIEKKQP